MNHFDLTIIKFFNSFAHRSGLLDAVLVWIMETNLVKGGIPMALCCWAWFDKDTSKTGDKREFLICGYVLSCFALAVGRLLALGLPYRDRPMHNPLIHIQLPYGLEPSVLIGWSSFPSDHAILFFCLAATLWMVSRPLGLMAAFHAVFLISLPRIYAGVHYPTDIIAGALIGCAVASLTLNTRLRTLIARPPLRLIENNPGLAYGLLFLSTLELSELFDTVRTLSHSVLGVVGHHLYVALR